MPALGALFDHEVDTKLGCIAYADACAVEQVAQHAAPRLLAVGCSTANKETMAPWRKYESVAYNTRVPLQNCFGVRVIEQARRDARHNVRAEGTAAGVARSKLQLVHQIGDRAGVERYCHFGLQAKAGQMVSRWLGGLLAFEGFAAHAHSMGGAATCPAADVRSSSVMT